MKLAEGASESIWSGLARTPVREIQAAIPRIKHEVARAKMRLWNAARA